LRAFVRCRSSADPSGGRGPRDSSPPCNATRGRLSAAVTCRPPPSRRARRLRAAADLRCPAKA